MAEIRVETERTIAAQQAALFKLVADYDGARPRFLPPNFADWRVVQGGLGGGTVVTYRLLAGKRERACQVSVEEETVGSVLVERDANSSLVTTWTLTAAGQDRTRVRVTTTWRGARGPRGFFERRFAPAGVRRIYDDVLDRLERLAAEMIPPPAPAKESEAPAPALPRSEFPEDLRKPVGPAARRAKAGGDAGGEAPSG